MIRITRGAKYIDSLMAYKIYINSVCVGKIRQNETKEFTVENGSHTVYAKADLYSSKLLHVDVSDSIVDLEVGNALTGWKRWLFPYSDSILFKRDEYLFLREKKEPVDKQ